MQIHVTTPVPDQGCIDTQVIGNVLLIGINRPAKRNGWTPDMFRQLGEAYTRLDDDPELRVGVLHAFGDHFTAGLDMPAAAVADFPAISQRTFASEDWAEGVRSFVEKRPAKFKGR